MSQMNIRALAKELGLSIATVSKALRDSHEISADTKKLVLEGAKKHNYHPNPYASSLRRKRSNTIAVVIPDVADSFFSLALRGINEVAQSKGYHVLIYLTYEHYETEIKILDDCRNGRVDGVLISASGETDSFAHVEQLVAEKIPVVFFDRAPQQTTFPRVVTDDFESACKATLHLIENGCSNLVYLSVSSKMDMNNQRISGFLKALQDSDLNGRESVISCTNNTSTNQTILTDLLSGDSPPDGMLLSVEKLIVPVYSACKILKIQIPQQLKLICFSTTEYADVFTPTLSTIVQPATDIGKQAAMLLFDVLKRKDFTARQTHIVVPSSLQMMESTKL